MAETKIDEMSPRPLTLRTAPDIKWLSKDNVLIDGVRYYFTKLAYEPSFFEPWGDYIERMNPALASLVTFERDDTGLGEQIFLNQPDPHTAVLLSLQPTCNHRWKATLGFNRVYEDCILCGAKKEDI